MIFQHFHIDLRATKQKTKNWCYTKTQNDERTANINSELDIVVVEKPVLSIAIIVGLHMDWHNTVFIWCMRQFSTRLLFVYIKIKRDVEFLKMNEKKMQRSINNSIMISNKMKIIIKGKAIAQRNYANRVHTSIKWNLNLFSSCLAWQKK